MRQTELHLSDEDRLIVEEIRSKGVHHSREVNRAHVLSCLDWGVPEDQIMAVLGIGRTAVWRTRAAYVQEGLELALFDVARSGRPRQYDTDAEAQVTALACSAPPEGRQRWTCIAKSGWRAVCRAGHLRPADLYPPQGKARRRHSRHLAQANLRQEPGRYRQLPRRTDRGPALKSG